MPRGAIALLALGALALAAADSAAGEGGAARAGRQEERVVLASSDFVWGLDGWEVVGDECKKLSHGPKMVRGGDLGNATWFFSAPAKFLGGKKEAYGGFLSFRHGYFEYDSAGEDPQSMAFDVVLTSEANEITVGRRAVMPEWSFSSTHTLDLLETAGWLHAASNTPPSKHEMVALLSKLSAVRIRGGRYQVKRFIILKKARIVLINTLARGTRTCI